MTPIPAYFLKDELVVEPYEGSTAYGETYGAPRTWKAYVRAKRQVIKGANDTVIVCTLMAYVKPSDARTLATQSRATFNGQSYTIRSVALYGDCYIALGLEP